MLKADRSFYRRAAGAATLVPALALLCAALLLPFAEIVQWSVGEAGERFKHYAPVLGDTPYRMVLVRTLEVCLISAALSVVLAYPLAYFLISRPSENRTIWLVLVLFPLWVSVLIRTYSWIVVLGREGVINSLLLDLGLLDAPLRLLYTRGAVYLAMVQVLMPVCVLILYSGMIQIDRSLIRAARVMGANPTQAFMTVFLPLSTRSIVIAGILSFVLSLGFFITPALVGGPGDLLVSNIIATQINETLDWSLAASLSVVLILATLTMICIGLLLARRHLKASTQGGPG